MFLNEPGRTNYDLNFNLFGFPVRIHPAFFILPIIFGASAGDGPMILVFTIVFFVSILIHELGHAIVMRYFGQHARIVLYMMGGLAIPDSGSPWSQPSKRFTSPQQILVSFAGPLAGFVLAVVFVLLIFAANGGVYLEMIGIFPAFIFNFTEATVDNEYLQNLLAYGVLINVYLNILNLAPVYPLDGGQISRELFVQRDSWNGLRYSIILSIVFAIGIGVYGFVNGARFLGIFFGFMAWSNWQMLQQSGGGYGGGRRPW